MKDRALATKSNACGRDSPLWLLIPAIVGSYLLFSLLKYGISPLADNPGFALLGSNRIPGFYDLKWILSYSACEGSLRELLATNTSCFGFANPHYPALSILLGRWLGMGPQDAAWAGILSGVGVMAVLAHVSWLCTTRLLTWSVTISLLWLSFPLQFLLERGNIDSIIFLLTALFCLVVWQRGILSVVLANTIAGLAIAIKIYPVLGIIGWLIYSIRAPMNQKRKKSLTRSLLLTTPISLVFTYLSIFSPEKITTGWGGLNSHGLTAMGYTNTFLLDEFGYQLGKISIRALIVFKVMSLLIGITLGLASLKNISWPEKHKFSRANLYAKTLIMISSAIGVGCYFISIGYDYRLIFILPLFAVVVSNLLDNSSLTSKSRWFLALLATASIYIFALPVAHNIDSKTLRFMELLDESILSPFLFAGLIAVWIRLYLRETGHVPVQAETVMAIEEESRREAGYQRSS
jgi:hypothetical protein